MTSRANSLQDTKFTSDSTTTAKNAITWRPSDPDNTNVAQFIASVNARHGLGVSSYQALHHWSISEISAFWEEIVNFFNVAGEGLHAPAIEDLNMPYAHWYPHARLNFAENVLRIAEDPSMKGRIAIQHVYEDNTVENITWTELRSRVQALAASLQERGVKQHDVVAAVLPNIPEAIIGLLAAASLGAIWSINSPDMSVSATLDRITQLQPKAIIGTSGYTFKGEHIDLSDYMRQVSAALPETDLRIIIYDNDTTTLIAGFESFHALVNTDKRLAPIRLAFDHPLWVLFSSGTTGAPKGIVHSHGGITLEGYKGIGLQQDMGRGDTYYVAANTSWMVWNTLAMTLLVGCSVVTYAGSPRIGGDDRQFEILALSGATMFATGAAYLALVEKSGLIPNEKYDLSKLRRIMSTGSPLAPSTWRWVHDAIKADVHLGSDSGGTDICSGLIGSNPLDAVYIGEIQGACLGVAAEVWDESGNRVYDQLGELVVTAPMPSMPIYFWNDPEGQRMHDAYFDTYPGIWRHGDWVTETSRGTFIVQGRSDATLNRQGVRLGTADIYAAIEEIPEIQQSLVLGIEFSDGQYYMPLFVQLFPEHKLTPELTDKINNQIRRKATPRHVPDEIIHVPEIPVSHTNKRLEVPIKRLYLGMDLKKALNIGSVSNPDALQWFVDHAHEIRNQFTQISS